MNFDIPAELQAYLAELDALERDVRAAIARGIIAFESRPSGRVAHTNRPPFGRVQVVPAGIRSRSASSSASRRSR